MSLILTYKGCSCYRCALQDKDNFILSPHSPSQRLPEVWQPEKEESVAW